MKNHRNTSLLISFVCLFIAPVVFGSLNATGQNYSADLLRDIDREWSKYLLTAPATINVLGQMMFVVSTKDISFQRYSPNHIYRYIKYPKSFQSTLFQISKESYRAFDNAHRKMSKIQMHMKQILRYIEIILKISSNDSAKVVNRVFQKSVKNIERISNTCVVLARNAQDSFKSLLNLVGEVIETTIVTQSLYELPERSQLKSTLDIPTDTKRTVEERRELINLVSRFGKSLNSSIQILSKNENQTTNNQELQAYKVIVNSIPQNNHTIQAADLIERAITLVDLAMKDELEILVDDIKSFIAAQERLSQTERHFDIFSANHVPTMKQMHSLTAKSDFISAKNVRFENTIELLQRELQLLIYLKQNCIHDLLCFFVTVYYQVDRGFNGRLESFVSTTSGLLDSEQTEIDIKLILEVIRSDLINLYQKSYLVFMLSRTYYDASSKYLIPRVSGLSSMLRNTSEDERKASINKLRQDTEEVQKKIQELIDQQKTEYKRAINIKLAEINKTIDDLNADGYQTDII